VNLRADGITLYEGANDQTPQSYALANGWADVRALIGEHREMGGPYPDGKTPIRTPAFSPAEFDGQIDPKTGLPGRKKKNVERVHFAVVDIDGCDPAEFVDFLRRIEGIAAIAYTTYNHGIKAGGRYRVLMPFTRPVLAAEWPKFWRWLDHAAGPSRTAKDGRLLDKLTKNADRLYFMPARPGAPRPTDFVLEQPGAPIDVDQAIAIGSTIKDEDEPGAPETKRDPTKLVAITQNDLKDLATTLKARKSADEKALGKAVDAIVKGEVYADAGNRDIVLFKIASRLADFFTNVDPEQAATLFIQSVEATCMRYGDGDPDTDIDKIVDKIARTQDEARAKQAQLEEEKAAELKREIQQAFRALNIERDTPYTGDELRTYRAEVGLPPEPSTGEEAFSKRWIIQRGRSYYVFVGGEYLAPLTSDELALSVRRDLSPAYAAGVRLEKFTANGDLVRKSVEDLVQDYGTSARKVTVNLAAQRTQYIAQTQEIIEAPCPVRTDIVACNHPEIDRWLYELAGGNAEDAHRLRSWLAFLTYLDQPCVALYLDGEGGVGKTLLAKGAARIWTKGGPSEFSQAISAFNDSIIQCPLVFADEKLPKEIISEGTRLLREFQQNTTRRLNRKHLPGAQMVGAIRMIMAANGKTMIETQESLSDVDIAAISERILYVNATNKARDVLRVEFGDRVNELVTRDLIAEHALYLRDSAAQEKPQGRFMIHTGARGELARALTTHSGVRAIVCQWLVAYLQNPKKYDRRADYLCHVREGSLWVNAQALADAWDEYPTNAKAPVAHKISQALAGLSHKERRQARLPKPVNYYVIDTENLVSWAEENAFSSREEIETALSKPTNVEAKARVTPVAPAGMFALPVNGEQKP
jgi:hypothetical protein